MKNDPISRSPREASASRRVSIYTDGACIGNPGPGGGAGVLLLPEGAHEFSFHEPHTTNNRMEMRAVIEALNLLEPGDVVVRTDSMYVINGATDWVTAWEARGWLKRNGEPVPNRDLWEQILEASDRHSSVAWKHVKGHSGDLHNERADYLAQLAATGMEIPFGLARGGRQMGKTDTFRSVRF